MGERKRRLAAAGPRREAGGDGPRIAGAFHALRAGDRGAAEEAFRSLQQIAVDDAEALHAVGVLGLQLGHAREARALLARATELAPGNPACRCHLAIAYRRLGRADLALVELETALRIDPALAEAHSNLGNVLLERGQHMAAMQSFERALAIRRDFPDALNGLGDAAMGLGQLEKACASYERAVALDPAYHEALYNLARACLRRAASTTDNGPEAAIPASGVAPAHARRALESIVAALQLRSDVPAYWVLFESCVRDFDLRHPVDGRLREALFLALGNPAVDPARLARPIVSLVTSLPAAAEMRRRLAPEVAFDARLWTASEGSMRALLGDAMLQRLLEDTVVASPFLQDLLAFARHGLLDECLHDASTEPSLPLRAIEALAAQAFNTEYLGDESEDERAGVSALQGRIERARAAAGPVPLGHLAIYACYRPLHTLEAPDRLAAELSPTVLRSLALRQIVEPLAERRIRAEIPALTDIVDGHSRDLRRQYEDNPYPRWQRVRRDVARSALGSALRRSFPDADLGDLGDAPARILIAGCGTGRESVEMAERFPDSSILAVDLSLASLAYAIRKTQELGIRNVEYRQADILALGPQAGSFDVVVCSGVLHHLKDPVEGWRTLCALLRAGGVMRVGLYSELARRHVVRAREVVAANRLSATPEGIRAARRAILAGQDDPLLARVTRGEDFYSLSGCRDLVFHVHESRFTLPTIAATLRDLGLAFLGFELPDAGVAERYRSCFPDDPALADLDHWDRYEAKWPDTFAQMYQFWVRKPA